MKKWLSFFALTLCLLSGLAVQAAADAAYLPYEGATYQLTYQENSDGTVTITGMTGTAQGQLVLPETIDGKPVTAIDSHAFSGCSGFTGALVIPDSITTIAFYAFRNCTGFTSLTLPEGLTTIENNVFSGCTGFTGALVIPDSVTSIAYSAFNGCSDFTSLTLSEGLTSITDSTFENCTGFTGTLTLPEHLTEICESAFRGCSGFTGPLTLPEGLVEIESYAFSDCSGFTGALDIPHGVTAIGTGAFWNCSGFTALMLPDSLTSLGNSAFYRCTGFTGSLTLPEGITELGKQTFYACAGFDGPLTLPEGLTSIGDSAFYNCSGLTGPLVLPDTLTELGTSAFCNCSSLTGGLVLPDGITELGEHVFYGCSGLNGELTLPEGLTSIGDYAFSGCSGLTGKLVLPESLTYIGGSSFSGCSGFTGALTLPERMTQVGSKAFRNCSGFTGTLILPDGMTYLGYSSFEGCTGFTGLVIGRGLTTIESSVFSGCTGFTGTLVIPDTVTKLNSSAFSGCTGFSGTLTLPGSLTSIGDSAFSGCTGFTGPLVLPDTVTELGGSAFANCSGLTALTFGRGVDTVPNSCFYRCAGLRQIFLPDTVVKISNYAFNTSPVPTPGAIQTFYQGSQEAWEAVSVNLSYNNMLRSFTYDADPGMLPGGGEERLGTVTAVGDGTVTIDGQPYPLLQGLEAESAWAEQYVLYTVNSDGAVTGVTVLLRAAGTLDDWTDRLSAEPLVTLSGVGYSFSDLGDRDFLLYLDLLMGQQVVFYRDAAYTVYRIEPDPDSLITLVGYVSSVSGSEEVTIDGHSFVPEEGVSVSDYFHRGKFVKYQVRGLNSLASIELLATDTGTLNAWDAAGQQLTISQKSFALSPLAGLTASEVEAMVTYTVSYTHDDAGTVYHMEWVAPDPNTFNEYTYRARFLMNASYGPTQTVNEYLAYQTPSEILLDAMEEEGFQVGLAAWEGVTIVADTAIDITNLDNISLMPRDLFAAIILDMLEVSCDLEVERGDTQRLSQVVGSATTWLDTLMGKGEVALSDLSEKQKEELGKQLEKAFYKEFPDMKGISDLGKVIGYYMQFVDVLTTLTDMVEVIYNDLMLYNMSQSMKDVLRTMYDEACLKGYPLQLQLALMDCMEIINAADPLAFVTETTLDATVVAGKGALKTAVSLYWAGARTQIQLAHPEILILQAAYSGSRLVCNQVFNTDEIVDQYWELLATVEVEHLLETTRATLATRFQRSGTVRDAQAYLDATGALFSIRKLDCDSAAKYVNAVDEALVSKLLALAGKTNDAFREDILSIRNSYQTGMDIARWGWVEYAMDRYPDLEEVREQYQKLEQLQKTLKAACPVDVYVYDQSGALVASVVGECITCAADAPIAIVKQGDVKTLYFYGDDQYNVVLTGYDAGAMDVVVTEYDQEGRSARTASFYDVPLTAEQTYQAEVFSQSGDYALTGEESASPLSPDVDTGRDTSSVTAAVENGAFSVNGALLQTVTGAPGQEYIVTAVIPEGMHFWKWTCTGGTVADPSSSTTTLRLPASGEVTLTAELTEMAGDPFWIGPQYWLAEPGEIKIMLKGNGWNVTSWSSTDSAVVSVNDSGHAVTQSPGDALITAVAGGGYSDSCTVVVRDYGALALEVLDSQGQAVTCVPDGPFTVEATVGNGALAEHDRCMLACYTADGQMTALIGSYETELLPDDSTTRLTFSVGEGHGAVARIKLFILLPRQELWPLSPAGVWEATE